MFMGRTNVMCGFDYCQHNQETESDSELSFEIEPGAGISGTTSRPNSLGFVPAVECLNKPNASGTDGEGD